jgi:hypothetical protein
MALRAGSAPLVARKVGAPSDRPARLRMIAWLAGNIARDQVGPIIATAAHQETTPLQTQGSTEPPPMAAPDGVAPDAAVAARASSSGDAAAHTRWSIGVGGGPVATVTIPRGGGQRFEFQGSTAYQIELQHQAAPGSILVGAALEVGPDQPKHYFGLAAFVGSTWRRRSWYIEGTLGLGVEALDSMTKTITVTNNSTQLGTVSETKVSSGPVPAIYVRPVGTAGLHLTQAFDLVAQLGAHISSTGEIGSYLGSTIGLRLRLP